MSVPPPQSLAELRQRADALSGLTLATLAERLAITLPDNFQHNKGWLGQLIEQALGASAGSTPQPDFPQLGVELKTIPLADNGMPKESTYVCAIGERIAPSWQQSLVWKKLAHVLWVPIWADAPIPQRRIGQPVLWQPNQEQQEILCADWQELTEMLLFGEADQLTAAYGEALQVRPKAANSRVLRTAIDADAQVTKIVPRGFYLRTRFTRGIILASRVM